MSDHVNLTSSELYHKNKPKNHQSSSMSAHGRDGQHGASGGRVDAWKVSQIENEPDSSPNSHANNHRNSHSSRKPPNGRGYYRVDDQIRND